MPSGSGASEEELLQTDDAPILVYYWNTPQNHLCRVFLRCSKQNGGRHKTLFSFKDAPAKSHAIQYHIDQTQRWYSVLQRGEVIPGDRYLKNTCVHRSAL